VFYSVVQDTLLFLTSLLSKKTDFLLFSNVGSKFEVEGAALLWSAPGDT